MLKAFLGEDENSSSRFIVSGLPPLELKTGRDGYFDGFIVSAAGMNQMWLTPSFDNKMAIIAAATIAKHEPMSYIQRDNRSRNFEGRLEISVIITNGDLTTFPSSLAIVRLQYNNSTMTWTRVVVENRPDPAHVEVYLVDYGAHQMVNARSLYEMPLELRRFPPQAFPIVPKISAPPDFGPGEWEKLENVRITVRLKSLDDNKFVCDQVTVYDANTRNDIDLGSALRSGIELERANMTVMTQTERPKHFVLAPVSNIDPDKPLLSAHARDQRDFSVLLVCAFGVVMAVASILMVIGFTYKRIQADRERRERRQRAERDQQIGPRTDAIGGGGPDDLTNITSVQPPTAATANEKSPQERTENVHQTKPSRSDEARKEHCIITLDPKAIAVIAGLMGSSSAILDRQLSRTIAIETRKETSTVDETYENRPRIGAGSDISSTRGSGSPQGFVSSTPVETVETTSSPQSSTTSSPQSSDQSSEPSTTGEPKKGSEKTTASESPSSIADEYFESVTADDIQRILKERAIMRQLQPSTMDSTSVSSFVSAVSCLEDAA